MPARWRTFLTPKKLPVMWLVTLIATTGPIDLEVNLSKGQDGNTDTGSDDKSHSSSSNSGNDNLDGSFQASSPHPCPKTLLPAPAKKPKETKGKTKASAALSGRDLGLAKAATARSPGAAKKKPQNVIDCLNDL
ncbi:hypothetical protein DFH09DRAFT_1068368 [Mycena vulgaris]|nr:hypothetical protein DFH09DRAFT_1068368 [Mycena vulgaris]